MLPATGSTTTAAMRRPRLRKSASTVFRELYCAVRVSAATAFGTPALAGMPSVARPLPPLARKPSACPW
jgi:hypothetical protein